MPKEGFSPEGHGYMSQLPLVLVLGSEPLIWGICLPLTLFFSPLLCLFFYRKDYSNEYSVLFI